MIGLNKYIAICNFVGVLMELGIIDVDEYEDVDMIVELERYCVDNMDDA